MGVVVDSYGLTLVTPSLHEWEGFSMPGALTYTRITSLGCQYRVFFVPMVFGAFLMERCVTKLLEDSNLTAKEKHLPSPISYERDKLLLDIGVGTLSKVVQVIWMRRRCQLTHVKAY